MNFMTKIVDLLIFPLAVNLVTLAVPVVFAFATFGMKFDSPIVVYLLAILLLCIVVVESLVLKKYFPTLLLFRKYGINRIWVSETKIDLKKQLESCTNKFMFMGISAKKTIDSQDFKNKIIEMRQTGGEVNFLLLSPDSAELPRKASEENDSSAAWILEIRANIDRLRELAVRESQFRIIVKVKIYEQFPIWRLLMLDEKKMYVHYFLPNQRGTESPLIELDRKVNGLFHAYKVEIDELWNRATYVIQ